MAPEISENAH